MSSTTVHESAKTLVYQYTQSIILFLLLISGKCVHFYVLINSVKRQPIITISGMHHPAETCPSHLNTVATLLCEMHNSYVGRLQQYIYITLQFIEIGILFFMYKFLIKMYGFLRHSVYAIFLKNVSKIVMNNFKKIVPI